jgi:diacylglycerol kinase (ATP)
MNMESPYKGKTGLRRLINAFGYSVEGIKAAYKNEDAFRQEVRLAVVLIPLAVYLGKTGIEQALMIGSVMLVIIVELLNSSIEATVDRVSLDHHKLAKRAKDIGSAAVLFSLVNLAVVWGLLIFG